VGVSAWQGHRASAFQATRDSVLVVSRLNEVAADSLRRVGDSLQTTAQNTRIWAEDALRRIERRYASLDTANLPAPDSTASDSLRFWRDSAGKAQANFGVVIRAVADYRIAFDSLAEAFQLQELAASRFRVAYEKEHQRAELLSATLEAAPIGCKKVLGLPIPKVGLGYAATTGGTGWAVGVFVPIGGC